MKVLDLFSGIGGFSLGLERAGMKTIAFCEIDPFCRRVLAKHWPDVPCHDDVQTLTARWLADRGLWPDVICGGFPCQDISIAGKGAGLAGERSGLWREYARVIGEIRPNYVIVENVAALLGRGLGDVLGDLAALGYDAEWHCIPASAVGAPHQRDRVWIIAHPQHSDAYSIRPYRQGMHERIAEPRNEQICLIEPVGHHVANAECGESINGHDTSVQRRRKGKTEQARLGGGAADVADAPRERRGEARQHQCYRSEKRAAGCRQALANSNGTGFPLSGRKQIGPHGLISRRSITTSDWWAVEPDVGRVAHGIPARVDRLRSLGNAVVPQIPELIGRAIMEAHA